MSLKLEVASVPPRMMVASVSSLNKGVRVGTGQETDQEYIFDHFKKNYDHAFLVYERCYEPALKAIEWVKQDMVSKNIPMSLFRSSDVVVAYSLFKMDEAIIRLSDKIKDLESSVRAMQKTQLQTIKNLVQDVETDSVQFNGKYSKKTKTKKTTTNKGKK